MPALAQVVFAVCRASWNVKSDTLARLHALGSALVDHIARDRLPVVALEDEMGCLDAGDLGAFSFPLNIGQNFSHGLGERRGLAHFSFLSPAVRHS